MRLPQLHPDGRRTILHITRLESSNSKSPFVGETEAILPQQQLFPAGFSPEGHLQRCLERPSFLSPQSVSHKDA